MYKFLEDINVKFLELCQLIEEFLLEIGLA